MVYRIINNWVLRAETFVQNIFIRLKEIIWQKIGVVVDIIKWEIFLNQLPFDNMTVTDLLLIFKYLQDRQTLMYR